MAALHYPLYVKPARGGSSLGITRVERGRASWSAAIEHAQQFDPKVIIEEGFVDARELECGVLGGLDGELPEASQVAEIRVHTESGFYDFDAKYLPEEQVDLDVPADVDDEIAEEVRRLAVRTFDAIGCEGLARVDVFVTRDRRVYVNEINTMPGFTAHSMFPRMWAAGGMDYPELVDRLLRLALRASRRSALTDPVGVVETQRSGRPGSRLLTASATSTSALASGAYSVGTPTWTYADRPIVVNR